MKKLVYLFLFVVLTFKLYADPWGTDLGSFNGIHCISNGSVNYFYCDYTSNCHNLYNGTNTGVKWQCVEYVNRYYLIHYNHNIYNPPSNAIDYYYNATQRGLVALAFPRFCRHVERVLYS